MDHENLIRWPAWKTDYLDLKYGYVGAVDCTTVDGDSGPRYLAFYDKKIAGKFNRLDEAMDAVEKLHQEQYRPKLEVVK